MANTLFNLIFDGNFEPGHDPDDARCILESLFEFDAESQVDFFNGQPVILGENMNAKTANSFKQALANSGVVTHLLAANDTSAVEVTKSRRVAQRRKGTERRARVRSSAILPDRRQGLDRRN